MEHLVSQHVIVATGNGCEVSYRSNTRNKSQERFSWWSDIANETKAYNERVRKSVLTPTPLIWVMMTRWGRGTSVGAEWESWVREMAAGCWMWDVQRWVVHSWRHTIILHQSCDFTGWWERNERFLVHYFTTFFKDLISGTDRKVEHSESSKSPKCLSISKAQNLIFHSFVFAIPWIPLRPLQHIFTSYDCSSLFLFFFPNQSMT